MAWLPACGPCKLSGAQERSHGQPIGNRRHSRLEACATPFGPGILTADYADERRWIIHKINLCLARCDAIEASDKRSSRQGERRVGGLILQSRNTTVTNAIETLRGFS